MKRLGGVVIVAVALGFLVAPTPARGAGEGGIDVVQIQGLLDPPNASLILDSIKEANDGGSTLLVFQVDSSGALDVDLDALVNAVDESRVPIAVWVGPSGASAGGAITVFAEAAHVLSVSPGSTIGAAEPVFLDGSKPSTNRVGDELARLAESRGRRPDGARQLTSKHLGADDAERVGAVDSVQPLVGELIVSLDGATIETARGSVKLSTANVIGEGRDRRRQPNQEVRFDRLTLPNQMLHTLSNPSIAFGLLLAGLGLIVFEFFTASIGLAGLAGALSLVGAGLGLSHLPVQWWALALIGGSFLAFAVDDQAGAGAGIWSGVGAGALVVGSLTLYGGSSRLNPQWWVLGLAWLLAIAFLISAIPVMIRARFSTPTVGRDGLIGRMGAAEVAVDPDGIVTVEGARWRARTNRATPIAAGEAVRVVAVQGVVLEVEPQAGGARDYRDRAKDQS